VWVVVQHFVVLCEVLCSCGAFHWSASFSALLNNHLPLICWMFYSWCSAWSVPPQMCHPSRLFLTLHVFVCSLFISTGIYWSSLCDESVLSHSNIKMHPTMFQFLWQSQYSGDSCAVSTKYIVIVYPQGSAGNHQNCLQHPKWPVHFFWRKCLS
jgi:hypothetical protein